MERHVTCLERGSKNGEKIPEVEIYLTNIISYLCWDPVSFYILILMQLYLL